MTGRVVDAGQPAWLQSDTDLAVALTAVEAETCAGCGHPRAEGYDPKLEFEWRAESLRCHACAARDRESRIGDMDMAGLHWIVRRREVPR